jgi:GDP-L-fucose synthase
MTHGNFYKLRGKKVWVAGHGGLLGSALVRRLQIENCDILTADRSEYDLRSTSDVDRWMRKALPQTVIVAAARVGGIYANDVRPAEFIYDNLMIEANVVEAARRYSVEKLLFLGSSCVYPRLAPQPIAETALLSGPLESTNQWYAIAKIAGIKLCQAYRRQYGCDFVSAMPTNLYGPGDRFDLENGHVVPALIAKAHRAKLNEMPFLDVWGTGRPLRELLHVDDAADALIFLLKQYSDEDIVNIGSGVEISVADLAREICNIVGFKGQLLFDTSKPDGTPRKVVDISRIRALGWAPRVSLTEGLTQTYRWYTEHHGTPVRGPVLDRV